ncbi:hypothetical protein C8J56DRAFT_1165076 [Mycena floridula]|nr:hypothetical protein C8J56DRAFT_1165076 [Mycena floridula]
MSSFSLVRRFRKQRKASVDSPVSSALVIQHGGHTNPESSNLRTRYDFPVSENVSSGSMVNNSHGLLFSSAALAQHVEGVSIRNIKGPVMSNNHVHITNYYGSQANFEDSDARDIYLQKEIGSYLDANYVSGTRYKGKIMSSSTHNMSIWSYCGERAAEEFEKAYQVYASLPRHPNILQLYGICRSPHLTALVFHGAPYFMDPQGYYKTLPSSQWMTHFLKFHQQYESAHSMLEAHNLHGWALAVSDVDERGNLVIAHFIPGSAHHPAFDLQICMVFEANAFIKENLLDYYRFLFDMIAVSFYPHQFPPCDKAATFQLSHPKIKLPLYYLPGDIPAFKVNGMDTTVKETGIVLTLLPNMTIRLSELWEIWTDFSCHAQSIENWQKDSESPGVLELLETEYLYLFCPQQDLAKVYWSRDEQGQHIIGGSSIQAAFGVTVDCDWAAYVHPIPPQFYQILRTIHEGCGFDPYSTQIAEFLRLPLLVADGGHSGLEEYVEDAEYTSESESGDSDYVSATEDA